MMALLVEQSTVCQRLYARPTARSGYHSKLANGEDDVSSRVRLGLVLGLG